MNWCARPTTSCSHRLAFAVGEKDGQKTIVLRVRPSKLPPPVLVLNALGFCHFQKLPNLFLPVGTRLHPPLRRDAVRKHLADDPMQVTWLYPGPDGSFTPESLPETAFRPLSDWIDYVLDHDHEPLQAWVQSAQFDFEPFVCDEDGGDQPKKPPKEPRAKAAPRRGQQRGPARRRRKANGDSPAVRRRRRRTTFTPRSSRCRRTSCAGSSTLGGAVPRGGRRARRAGAAGAVAGAGGAQRAAGQHRRRRRLLDERPVAGRRGAGGAGAELVPRRGAGGAGAQGSRLAERAHLGQPGGAGAARSRRRGRRPRPGA